MASAAVRSKVVLLFWFIGDFLLPFCPGVLFGPLCCGVAVALMSLTSPFQYCNHLA